MIIRVEDDRESLCTAAAEIIVEAAADAIRQRGRFLLAISGGSTPRPMFEQFGGRFADRIDWSRTHIFFADERFVPVEDPASNYGVARRLWFQPAGISPENVHAVPVDAPTSHEAAEGYERVVREVAGGGMFDLILLGVGSDGHTASLFGEDANQKADELVRAVHAPAGIEPRDRITLSLHAINAARSVVFLVTGSDKRPVITEILGGRSDARRYPAARVQPRDETVWLLDREAAPANV